MITATAIFPIDNIYIYVCMYILSYCLYISNMIDTPNGIYHNTLCIYIYIYTHIDRRIDRQIDTVYICIHILDIPSGNLT